MFEELPTIIRKEENEELQKMPSKEEVYKVLMGLNRNSVYGLLRMT